MYAIRSYYAGVSNISASTMINQVTSTANRLYDAEDLTKQFAAGITASQALALLYPMTGGTYTDLDGYIYTLVSGNLVYNGSRVGVASTIYGEYWRNELVIV